MKNFLTIIFLLTTSFLWAQKSAVLTTNPVSGAGTIDQQTPTVYFSTTPPTACVTIGLDETLTLDHVIDIISFPKDGGIYKSLKGLCEVWYGIALEENCTEQEAAIVALEKLGDKIDEMAGWGKK